MVWFSLSFGQILVTKFLIFCNVFFHRKSFIYLFIFFFKSIGLTLNIVDRRVVTRRCSRRDDLIRREIMCSSCGQIIHEAGDPDQEQEKQEHEIEHQQGVEGHQLHRARTTFSTITHIYTRILTQARSLNPPTEFSFTLNFYYFS